MAPRKPEFNVEQEVTSEQKKAAQDLLVQNYEIFATDISKNSQTIGVDKIVEKSKSDITGPRCTIMHVNDKAKNKLVQSNNRSSKTPEKSMKGPTIITVAGKEDLKRKELL
ncbi:2097_t:CDS:2 [Racocetra fulgida]|uniref:2097_t:CDS:1 n=1 Tax=Racocetra fulgida TaxID=60492 RepID=A0A9N8Z1K1_9GLOM|nr:2097_t:CDS:2 [Racocetra fulgida]